MKTLEQFIQSNPPALELKRAIAVQMSQSGYSYRQICDILQMSVGFITASNQRYKSSGVEGLRSNYRGTKGYLDSEQKQALFKWLNGQDTWTLEEVIDHIEDEYGVIYQSLQSYYALFKDAGFSWKKVQPAHPDQNETLIQEKKENLKNDWQRINLRSPAGN